MQGQRVRIKCRGQHTHWDDFGTVESGPDQYGGIYVLTDQAHSTYNREGFQVRCDNRHYLVRGEYEVEK